MSTLAPPEDAVSVIAQEFIVDEPCALAVDVPGAATYLRPGSRSDRLEIDISVSGCSADEAESILDRMQMSTQQMKDTVRVYSDGDRSDAEWWRWVRTLDVTVHLDLRLPSHVEGDFRVPGGTIDLADLKGHIDLKVMGGTCHARNLQGTLDVRAESSDITIEDFSGAQRVARVAVGELSLDSVTVDSLTVRSVSAPISLTSAEGTTSITANSASVDVQEHEGACTIRSQGGPVRFDGEPDEETELTVVGSTLNVHLPRRHQSDLTMMGSTLGLDDRFSFEGDRSEHEIKGTLNKGGSPLILRAIGGTAECHVK
jgi:hypothetical protein